MHIAVRENTRELHQRLTHSLTIAEIASLPWAPRNDKSLAPVIAGKAKQSREQLPVRLQGSVSPFSAPCLLKRPCPETFRNCSIRCRPAPRGKAAPFLPKAALSPQGLIRHT